jgi:hypothetical protein
MSLKIFPGKAGGWFTLFCFCFLVFPASNLARSSDGNLMGFVYGKDGKSPLQGAVVLLKGADTEQVYQSEPTGKTGNYRIENIDVGTYIVGLKINEDTFNVDGYVEVAGGKTDTLSLALGSPPVLGGAQLDERQGWCCHEGKVFKSTGEECSKRGGKFFATKKEAKDECGIPAAAFFKRPTGIAVLIAGTAALGFGIYKLVGEKKEKEVSATER